MDWELQFLDYLQTWHNPVLDTIMVAITSLGDAGIIWILLALVLVIIPKTRKIGIVLGVALVIDLLICNVILKNSVARTRPFEYREGLELLVKRPKDYSFPSGHTAASFTSVTGLFLSRQLKMAWAALVLAILIAFSRLYIYVHFPTDILGGIGVGLVAGFLGWFIVEKVMKSRVGKKANG